MSVNSSSPLAPLAAGGTLLALVVLGGGGFVIAQQDFVADTDLAIAVAAGFGTLGCWIWARAELTVGRRMAGVAIAAALNWAAQAWSAHLWAAWLQQWTWVLPLVLVPYALCRFPTGLHPGGIPRAIERTILTSGAATSISLGVGALGAPYTLLTGATSTKPWFSRALILVAIAGLAVWAVASVGQVLRLIVQVFVATGQARGQAALVTASLALTLLALAGLLVSDALGLQVLAGLALPVGMWLAVLRHSLWDLDLLVRRSLVWLVLSIASVGIVYLVVAAGANRVSPDANRLSTTAVLTALVCVLAMLHGIVQRAIDKLLYGHRSQPAVAVSTLGRDLSDASARDSVEAMCCAVAGTIAIPWVGLTRGAFLVGEWGRPTSEPLRWALGTPEDDALLLAPRRAGERFARADLTALSALTPHVAVASRALGLAADLQAARERLSSSREEERKRIRDDLHDTLGPALAGVRFQVRALPRTSGVALDDIDSVLASCVADVTTLIEGLRPTSLDHGLTHALTVEVRRWQGGGAQVNLEVTRLDQPDIPLQVESTALKIASEALSNAVRHAQAGEIHLRAAVEGGPEDAILSIEVTDNGIGQVVAREGGVGLQSMRDRAEELGGRLMIAATPGQGTSVRATLPLRSTVSLSHESPTQGSALDASPRIG